MSHVIQEQRTDGSVHIKALEDGRYEVFIDGVRFTNVGLINIGGRASAFDSGAELELGGGENTVIVREEKDSRRDGLVAIGFEADAIL